MPPGKARRLPLSLGGRRTRTPEGSQFIRHFAPDFHRAVRETVKEIRVLDAMLIVPEGLLPEFCRRITIILALRPGSHRYQVTVQGRQILTALLAAREANTDFLTSKAG